MTRKCAGIALVVVGLVILIAGLVSTGVILALAPSALKESAQMKVNGESGYDTFIDTRSEDAPPLYFEYTMYNISNVYEMQDATTPIAPVVTEIGPFVYREYCTRTNVSVSDSEEEIEYSELCWKEYQKDLSIDAVTGEMLSESTPIYGIYYTYFGVLDLYGQTTAPATFMLAAFQQVLSSLFSGLSTAAPTYYTEDNIAQMFFNYSDPTVSPIPRVATAAASVGTDLNFDFESDLFVTHVTVPDISATFSADMAKAFLFGSAGISSATCGTDSDTACSAYFVGIAQAAGTQYANAAAVSFDPADSATATAKATINALSSPYGFPQIDGTDASTLATQFADTINYYTWFSSYLSYAAGHYFGLAFTENHSYTGDASNANSLSESHYFTQRTPREILFSMQEDKFAERLGSEAQGSLFAFSECPETFNALGHDSDVGLDYDTCYNEWQTTDLADERYRQLTGRSNIEEVETITKWRSLESLPMYNTTSREGYWCTADVPVVGRRNPNGPSSGVDFSTWSMDPVIREDYKMHIWNADTLRNVTLSYVRDSSVRGVSVKQYTVDPENFTPGEADVNFEIQEYGVFNMTCPKGTSIYLTFPHFLLSSFLTNDDLIMPEGVRDPDSVSDAVLIDVEPLTGKTIQAHFKLQINMRIPTGIPGFTGSEADSRDVVFPMMYLNKHSKLTASDASTLSTAHTALLDVPLPVFIVACTVGPVFFLIGLYLIISAAKKAAADGAVDSSASKAAPTDNSSATGINTSAVMYTESA